MDGLNATQRATAAHVFKIGHALGTPYNRKFNYSAGSRFGVLRHGILHEHQWVCRFIIWC
jgi:hypothetical protein